MLIIGLYRVNRHCGHMFLFSFSKLLNYNSVSIRSSWTACRKSFFLRKEAYWCLWLLLKNLYTHCNVLFDFYNKLLSYLIASSQSDISIRECERAPVPVYRRTKQLNISKTKRFWHMVYRTKNVCFHPLNPFPTWTGPTLALSERLYLGNYHTYDKNQWTKWS